MHRLHARLAGLARPATGFVSQPEPRSIGHYARGRQLVAGNFLFSGHLIEAPGLQIWDIAIPDPAFEDEVQGFAWLDDLAAVGDAAARKKAQDWTWGWIARFGRGTGPGWTPDLTGRRIIRWINHALFLLNGLDRTATEAYYRALSRQTVFLSRRWHTAAPGLPRFEALTGLIYAGLALTGMERYVSRARAALARECAAEIDAEGGIPTRNPEELLEVFTLLIWAAQALAETGRRPGAAHLAAIERVAPTLRALRHADGGLARFHGGGRGLEGRLDQALADSGVKPAALTGLAMGFARLSGGRTSVIADAAPPPDGQASLSAHASTLAFELTSGRRAVIVSCGSGVPFGPDWRRAGRATASHSTLEIEGFSSSRLGGGGNEQLTDLAWVPLAEMGTDPSAARLDMSHEGWVETHGLTHTRHLVLTQDGRHLSGEDTLEAITPEDRRLFERVMNRTRFQGVQFMIRFHLHPDVDAAIDMGGAAVSLVLKSGELWIFRHSGGADLSLQPSVYLERGRLKPRPTRQIVLSATLQQTKARIGWTLAKAQDTPLAIRDLDRDDPAALA
ncbi:MAG: heparinase II/III family protein [Rhodobacter sp.]|nr:heparinase II/III family protein [Rhodobacter sp.]MCA3459027.1 heparinase II/III family protein [Rhodobacter sp.]MCA3462741.1 heparinase II/III family protein [Rhodobacter sp.]MCA3463495.1 heparinase II/III family protein [Rhodobacter sp.]MCA3466751.1 heparinase II/III family protein [Rhodobacter sp.]